MMPIILPNSRMNPTSNSVAPYGAPPSLAGYSNVGQAEFRLRGTSKWT